MNLTPRLLTIANMVKYQTVADIGTDHGKLPVYLIQNNICQYAVASDVNEGPVNSCIKNINRYGLSEKISARLCDGLSGLEKNECETIVVAGMGGELISEIIDGSYDVARSAKELILQPMTGIDKLKIYLAKAGFEIVEEVLSSEKNKIYLIIKVVYNKPYEIKLKDVFLSDMILANTSYLLEKYLCVNIKRIRDKLKGCLENKIRDEYVDLLKKMEIEYESIRID